MTSQGNTLVAAGILFAGASVFGATLCFALFASPQEEQRITPQETPVAERGSLPERLEIPSLGISAHVQQVGIGKSGNMAVPSNYSDVGWYRYGTIPGFKGSAVIDGHVDNGLGLPGVFKNLDQMQVGDKIDIVTASSTRLRFVVQEVVIYPYKEVPLEKLFNRDDQGRLNLVTCDGAWIAGEKTYDKRLVVYATLQE